MPAWAIVLLVLLFYMSVAVVMSFVLAWHCGKEWGQPVSKGEITEVLVTSWLWPGTLPVFCLMGIAWLISKALGGTARRYKALLLSRSPEEEDT